MQYSVEEIKQYAAEEDVKFIRLAFCDCFGRPKNISIMPHELERAFKYGIAIDASAIAGFGDEVNSDLFLHPDASTIALLPWRPEHGSVVRMFCQVTYPDGTPLPSDSRAILKKAVADAGDTDDSAAIRDALMQVVPTFHDPKEINNRRTAELNLHVAAVAKS